MLIDSHMRMQLMELRIQEQIDAAERSRVLRVARPRRAWRAEGESREGILPHIPGKPPPLPRRCISSIWRIIFFDPPPFIIFIIFCIC